MSTITTSYEYCGGEEKEFIFSCKGRPFTSLVSSFLPTPPSTLIDYSLVRDLNLKMTNLQCQKFHYGGHKMRILGHVTTAVQTIIDGFTAGNYQFSAKVVLDLNKNLDTFSIAGHKMSKQLSNVSPVTDAQSSPTPAASWSPTAASSWSPTPAPVISNSNNTPKTKRTPKKKIRLRPEPVTPPRAIPSAHPSQGRPSPTTSQGSPSPTTSRQSRQLTPRNSFSPSIPMFSPSSPLVLDSVSPREAPPGFPIPLFGKDYVGKLPTCLSVQCVDFDPSKSPRSENISCLNKTFGGADKLPFDDEKSLLQSHYKDAVTQNLDEDFQMLLSNGLHYRSGHGEFKCNQVKCLDPGTRLMGLPNNCGFHRQWLYPDEFRPCGPKCRGAYCECIKLSNCNY